MSDIVNTKAVGNIGNETELLIQHAIFLLHAKYTSQNMMELSSS